MSPFASARAVFFDCWSTLIYEPDFSRGRALRVEGIGGLCGIDADRSAALLERAWQEHHDAWCAERNHGSIGIAKSICAELEIADPSLESEILRVLEEASLDCDVAMVDGALDTLAQIKAAGRATALVCDTGLTPGRLVRKLLASHGLDGYLDELVFSDEVGVPKPNRRMFEAALAATGGVAAVHVGDLKRTDVAGARGAGLGSVRFRGVYDDPSEHPEADVVIDDLRALPALLGL